MILYFIFVYINVIVSGENCFRILCLKFYIYLKYFKINLLLYEVLLCIVMYIIFKMFCILIVYSGRYMKNV